MWLRLRLDIRWRDLGRGLIDSLSRSGRQSAQENLEAVWSNGRDDALAALSVRSGFDLFLQALELPAGSEVLFSAVTIQDMTRIVEGHGLVPVPVDVAGSDYHLDIGSLRERVTPKSRILVVAHLFGARPEMREIFEFAQRHELLLVEDCAQAWCGEEWRGNEQADACLFSFGTIKTATALGGALCRIKDANLLNRMREIQSSQPVQEAGSLLQTYAKFAILKAISVRPVFGAIAWIGRNYGKGVDDVLGRLTRGFSEDSLFPQLRKRLHTPRLKMLLHRITTYDLKQIERRIENARRICTKLELAQSQSELRDARHSFWLFPFAARRAEELIIHLRSCGFDSTMRGHMEVVSPPADRPELLCPQAEQLLSRTVFLPCYAEMPLRAIDRMCDEILTMTGKISPELQE